MPRPGLTCVFYQGRYVVAQHFAQGHVACDAGLTVLRSCRRHAMPGTLKRSHLESRLGACGFVSESIRLGWTPGAQIIDQIAESEGKIFLYNCLDLAGDSARCAQAYVLDLDENVLEVLGGCRTEPIAAWERFAGLYAPEGFHPVGRLARFDLLDLPPDDRFVDEVQDAERAVVGPIA